MTSSLNAFDAAAILITLAALLGYLNNRFLGLPSSVGLTVMGAVASLLVIALDRILPSSTLAEQVSAFVSGIDFQATLMEGMLSFLLFAGALHVDWTEMRRGRLPILVLSTVGVLLSTTIVGGGFYLLSPAHGIDLPLLWCFVFGALISPTDPVAVMGVLKRAAVPPTLQATVAGESLFTTASAWSSSRSSSPQRSEPRRSRSATRWRRFSSKRAAARCLVWPWGGLASGRCARSTNTRSR